MAKQARSVFSVDVTGLDKALGQPAYARIYDRIRIAITSGALALNARLPSSRILGKNLHVARNTVEAALGQLVADGYIIRRRGAGSFVTARLPTRDLHPRALTRVPIAKSGSAERRLSQRALALKLYPGHYRPILHPPDSPDRWVHRISRRRPQVLRELRGWASSREGRTWHTPI